EMNEATDTFEDTLGLEMVKGRWFDASDDGQQAEPIVINEQLAREAFGEGDPIGKKLPWDDSPHRIVGVFTDFRRAGEFAAPVNYLMKRVKLGDAGHQASPELHGPDQQRRPPRNILIRV